MQTRSQCSTSLYPEHSLAGPLDPLVASAVAALEADPMLRHYYRYEDPSSSHSLSASSAAADAGIEEQVQEEQRRLQGRRGSSSLLSGPSKV